MSCLVLRRKTQTQDTHLGLLARLCRQAQAAALRPRAPPGSLPTMPHPALPEVTVLPRAGSPAGSAHCSPPPTSTSPTPKRAQGRRYPFARSRSPLVAHRSSPAARRPSSVAVARDHSRRGDPSQAGLAWRAVERVRVQATERVRLQVQWTVEVESTVDTTVHQSMPPPDVLGAWADQPKYRSIDR